MYELSIMIYVHTTYYYLRSWSICVCRVYTRNGCSRSVPNTIQFVKFSDYVCIHYTVYTKTWIYEKSTGKMLVMAVHCVELRSIFWWKHTKHKPTSLCRSYLEESMWIASQICCHSSNPFSISTCMFSLFSNWFLSGSIWYIHMQWFH